MQMNAVRTLTVRGQSQGLDRVASDLNKVSAAQDKVSQTSETMARTTETSSRRQLSAGRDFQRLMERNDRLVYLQAQLGKEMATVNRAFEQGAVSAQQHARAVELVEGKYQRLAAAEIQARQASMAATSATDSQAAAMHRLAAANDNARGSTANIAAQFQDIGVTAAMGMSPVMIALQQGTQLSAVLNTMQNPLKGLGTAFLSILNPVSLLTIGFVALTATAIQFFTASNDNAKKAAGALEEHSEWLNKTLAGYDRVRDAAEGALDAALKLPEGLVVTDLQIGLKEQEEAARKFAEQIAENNSRLSDTVSFLREIQETGRSGGGEDTPGVSDAIRQIELLSQLGVTADSTRAELDAAAVASKQLYASTDDPAIKQMANDANLLVMQLLRMQAQADSTATALRNIPREIQISISMGQEFGSTMADLQSLYIDPRSRFEVAREEAKNHLDQLTALSQSHSDLAGAAREYERVLGSINAAETAANTKSEAKGVAKAERDLEQLAEAYKGITRGSREFSAEQLLEASVLGMTEEAANRLRYEQDLLNQATAANISLTPEQKQELVGLASEMATVEAQVRSLTEAYGFSKEVMVGFGKDWLSGFGDRMAKADTAHEETRLKNITDLMREAQRDGAVVAQEQRVAIMEMAQAMADAEHGATSMERVWRSAWESMADAAVNALQKIADRAADQLLNGLFDNIFGMAMGALGGGFGTLGMGGVGMPKGGFVPGLTGPKLFANGDVLNSPSLSAYSNQIHDTPKWFKFANGGGVFGEAGPEAIMPLGRDSHGRLGVRAANSNIGAANSNGPRVTVNNYGTPQSYRVQSVSRDEIVLIARDVASGTVDSFSKHELPHRVRDISNDSFGN